MATTVERPKLDNLSPSSGGRGPLNPSTSDLRAVKYSPPPASTGIWVVLASITMTFLAFTSALVVRQGGASDWHHLTLPPILYLNTLLLIASSVALEFGRREIRGFMTAKEHASNLPSRWLNIALVLGALFVVGQITAWMQLGAQGLYLATNPNSSFFYVLTVAHALHISGGLGGLLRVIRKLKNGTLRKSTLDATSHYWHFMDGLWIYLLWLLWARL